MVRVSLGSKYSFGEDCFIDAPPTLTSDKNELGICHEWSDG